MAKGRGAPAKYNSEFHPKLARYMARSGATDDEVAKEFGIARSTLYEWKKKYQLLSDALKENKQFTDYLVEDSLLKRALGYDYAAIEETELADGGVITKRTTKHIKPDVTAQIFWLKNRQPDKWRDKQDEKPLAVVDMKDYIDALNKSSKNVWGGDNGTKKE